MEQMHICTAGGQQSIYPEDQIRTMWQRGLLADSVLYWQEGMTEWRPLHEYFAPAPSSMGASLPPIPPALIRSSQTATTAEAPTTAFFLYIPKARLVAMSLVTLGLYEVYWIYRNWRFLKERDNLRIQPFWRSIFDIFFIKSLLTAIKSDRAFGRLTANVRGGS
jgi:hypothetical protein